jgi:hypothetical protein
MLGGRIFEPSHVYWRIGLGRIAERLNLSVELVTSLVGDMLLSGVLRARTDGDELFFLGEATKP